MVADVGSDLAGVSTRARGEARDVGVLSAVRAMVLLRGDAAERGVPCENERCETS